MEELDTVFRQKIQGFRKKKGWTLKELASHSQCSSALLSQIETGAVNPSLTTLMAIAGALEVSVSDLFSNPAANKKDLPFMIDPGDRKTFTLQGGIQLQLLSRGIDVPFEFILFKFPPGSSNRHDLYTHEGTECGIIIEGELEVQVNDQVYHLKAGDSITLHSSSPHKVANRGKNEAVAIWVASEPLFFSTK